MTRKDITASRWLVGLCLGSVAVSITLITLAVLAIAG